MGRTVGTLGTFLVREVYVLVAGRLSKTGEPFKGKTMLANQRNMESYDLKTVHPHDSAFTLEQFPSSLWGWAEVWLSQPAMCMTAEPWEQ